MKLADVSAKQRPQYTIPHDAKIAKQVKQIHKAVVKPHPPMWPAHTYSSMLPDAE